MAVDPVGIIRAVNDLLSTIAKAFGMCLTATGTIKINELKFKMLAYDYKQLSKRLSRIQEDFCKDPDRYIVDIDSEIEGLSELFSWASNYFERPRSRLEKVYSFLCEVFGTQVNQEMFDILTEVHNKFVKKAEAIEVILTANTLPLAINPNNPRPTVIVLETITVEKDPCCNTSLIVKWKDQAAQINYIAEYQIEVADVSGTTRKRYIRMKIQDHESANPCSINAVVSYMYLCDECTIHVRIANLCSSTWYAVRICKVFHNKERSIWSADKLSSACTGNLCPVAPKATHNPFKSPRHGVFTISIHRPERYKAIPKCKVYATPVCSQSLTKECKKPYESIINLNFDETKKVDNLEFIGFNIPEEECKFELRYIDDQSRASQEALILNATIGSLTPSEIETVNVTEYDQTAPQNVTVSWNPPKDNAGATKLYIVYYYQKGNGKRKKWSQKKVKSNRTRTKIKNLDRSKDYIFGVECQNYAGETLPHKVAKCLKKRR